ncbi:MAG: hypothetical protein ABIH68_01045 [bacterium]
MEISSDYEDLFKTFNKHKVKYLVIGAYAVIYYTEPRYTKDIDVWVKPDRSNSERVYEALKEFGAPLSGMDINKDFFTKKNMVYQIGVAPVRVDVLMGIEGVDFDKSWKNREKVKYGRTMINFIGMADLIKNKRKAKRKIDEVDIEMLLKARKMRAAEK